MRMHAGSTAVLLVAALAALTGCATGTGPAPESSSDDDGVRASVYQPRPDIATGRMAIQVHNDSDDELVVTTARLESADFAEPLVWSGDREPRVLEGRALDLRVDLGETVCAEDGQDPPMVVLGYRLGDGAERTTELTPDDPYDLLPRLHDEACLVERLADVVVLTAVDLVSPAGAGVPGEFVVAVDPTGDPGTAAISHVYSTTLLAPARDGVGVSDLPVDVRLGADGPPELRIPIVPNRCDVHALQEDKVGTRIPLEVTAPDGTTGRLVLPATDELRKRMYAFYTGYCGL